MRKPIIEEGYVELKEGELLRSTDQFWDRDEQRWTAVQNVAHGEKLNARCHYMPVRRRTFTFKAGDTVKHEPSGETWILKRDEIDGYVFPCGWPESQGRAEDCTRVR